MSADEEAVSSRSPRLIGTDSDGVKRIELTLTVDVDPAWLGFDQPIEELERKVLDAIDARPGLEVVVAEVSS